jgi:hydroxymethylglutaryl-CoA lyase
MEEGITKFDSCIAGLGGCPFAPGASGNLATEDLVSMLHKEGYETGINEEMLSNSAKLAAQLTS